MNSPEETNSGPVIHDRRRIDPATGQVRDTGREGVAGAGGAAREAGATKLGRPTASRPGSRPAEGQGPAPDTEPEPGQTPPTGQALADQLAERTADLQRVSAEYANYRKRVERDRMAVREQALSNVLAGLLPVLDDIGRAREHGELTGGFKSVAESLESAVTKLGLDSFGAEGEPFDPNVHEALMHSFAPDVTEPTCVRILQPGYRVGDRTLRPARVAVAEPGEAGGGDSEAGGGDSEAETPGTSSSAGEQETRASDD